MEDYWGTNEGHPAHASVIAVPTTSGTGARAPSYALIAHPTPDAHEDACVDREGRRVASRCVANSPPDADASSIVLSRLFLGALVFTPATAFVSLLLVVLSLLIQP